MGSDGGMVAVSTQRCIDGHRLHCERQHTGDGSEATAKQRLRRWHQQLPEPSPCATAPSPYNTAGTIEVDGIAEDLLLEACSL